MSDLYKSKGQVVAKVVHAESPDGRENVVYRDVSTDKCYVCTLVEFIDKFSRTNTEATNYE